MNRFAGDIERIYQLQINTTKNDSDSLLPLVEEKQF